MGFARFKAKEPAPGAEIGAQSPHSGMINLKSAKAIGLTVR